MIEIVETKDLGAFILSQPIMRVSDPCYKKTSWCSHTIDNCLPGEWTARMMVKDEGRWGKRVSKLIVAHNASFTTESVLKTLGAVRFKNNGNAVFYPHSLQLMNDVVISVDSGQAGFFDEVFYQEDSSVPENWDGGDFGSLWYSYCCDITLTKKGGVLNNGALSSSGYGDGCYNLFVHRNKDNKVDGMCILFC